MNLHACIAGPACWDWGAWWLPGKGTIRRCGACHGYRTISPAAPTTYREMELARDLANIGRADCGCDPDYYIRWWAEREDIP